MLFGVGATWRILYSIVSYLYVSCSGSITSVGEERANLSAIGYLKLCGFFLERFPLPRGAWNGLRYSIVALPAPSIYLVSNVFFMSSKMWQYGRISFARKSYRDVV